MKILIIDNHTIHLDSLIELISEYDVSIKKRENFTAELTNNFDLIILSGGSHVAEVESHESVYHHEITFLKSTNKPVIGICLGCEIIAKAFDCTLEKMETKEKGIIDVNFLNETVEVYEGHRYCISSISNKIIVMGRSRDGVEVIKHKSKPIYGLQFHPEMFCKKTDGKKIFKYIIDKINIK